MASELMKLTDDAQALRKNTSGCTQTLSPSRNSRISALETPLAMSSDTLVSMASHLSEAEGERSFKGKNWWNQVRSLAESKNLLNYLFNIPTSTRCQLLDRDAICFEKDLTIKELTEKVIHLTSMPRQSEAQKIEMQQKLQKLDLEMHFTNILGSPGSLESTSVEDGHIYALRKASRRSQFLHGAGYSLDILEDMDTSDSGSDIADLEVDDEVWIESGKKLAKRRSEGDAVQMEGKPDTERCCSCSRNYGSSILRECALQ